MKPSRTNKKPWGKKRLPVAKPGHRILSKKDYVRSKQPDYEEELGDY